MQPKWLLLTVVLALLGLSACTSPISLQDYKGVYVLDSNISGVRHSELMITDDSVYIVILPEWDKVFENGLVVAAKPQVVSQAFVVDTFLLIPKAFHLILRLRQEIDKGEPVILWYVRTKRKKLPDSLMQSVKQVLALKKGKNLNVWRLGQYLDYYQMQETGDTAAVAWPVIYTFVRATVDLKNLFVGAILFNDSTMAFAKIDTVTFEMKLWHEDTGRLVLQLADSTKKLVRFKVYDGKLLLLQDSTFSLFQALLTSPKPISITVNELSYFDTTLIPVHFTIAQSNLKPLFMQMTENIKEPQLSGNFEYLYSILQLGFFRYYF